MEVHDDLRVLLLDEVVLHHDGDALKDLVLVVGEQVAARRASHRVVEEVVEVQAQIAVVRRHGRRAGRSSPPCAEVDSVRARGGQPRDLHLHRPAGLEQLTQAGLARVSATEQRGRDVVLDHGHAAVDTPPALDDPGGEDADRLADGRLAHLHLVCHLFDGRQRSPSRYAPERIAKVIWSTTRSCMRGSSIGRNVRSLRSSGGLLDRVTRPMLTPPPAG